MVKHTRRKPKELRRKFDNCVMAVRKTVKARKGSTKKQAAYAICTSTVLSKKGGAIIGKGADTCVFSPPVACSGASTNITGEQADSVSRIVETSGGEHQLQTLTYNLIKTELEGKGKSDLLKFFLFGSSYCQPNTTDADFVDKECKFKTYTLSKTNKPNSTLYTNIVTPKYDSDIEQKGVLVKSQDITRKAIHDLMTALTYINEKTIVAHNDTHFGNIGWRGDQIILTDWGRVKIGNTFLKYVNDRVTVDYKQYSQHVFHVFLKFDEDKIFDEYDYERDNGIVLARVWDILGILGSAVKYRIVSSQSATDFFSDIKELLKRTLPRNKRSSFGLDKLEKLVEISKQAIKRLQEDKTISEQVRKRDIAAEETELQDYLHEIEDLNKIKNFVPLSYADFTTTLRTKIDELFAKNTPVPLPTPAVEPPEALSPTDLNLIQADLFQRSSSSTIGSLAVTKSEGGSFQKRTRTHNVHKQPVRNR
jgi:hypothetical protein